MHRKKLLESQKRTTEKDLETVSGAGLRVAPVPTMFRVTGTFLPQEWGIISPRLNPAQFCLTNLINKNLLCLHIVIEQFNLGDLFKHGMLTLSPIILS